MYSLKPYVTAALKTVFVYKNHLELYFPPISENRLAANPLILRIPTYERNYRFIALSVHSLCYLNQIPKAPQLGSLVVVFSTDFDLWPAPMSCFSRFSCVTGIFIFSSRYKSRRAMLVMSEGRLDRNMRIYQIFTSEETWMLIKCIIAKVAAQVVR